MQIKNMVLATLSVLSLYSFPSQSTAATPDVAKYVAQQGWTLSAGKLARSPVTDAAFVLYGSRHANAQSCGLLTQSGAVPVFFPMSEPDGDEGCPICSGINEALVYVLNGKPYLIVEFVEQSTREDYGRMYFYAYKDAAGRYVADAELNASAAAIDQTARTGDFSVPHAKNGIRQAKAFLINKMVPGMAIRYRDFIDDDARAFAIFQDEAKSRCSFGVQVAGKLHTFAQDAFADGDRCHEVLASSKLEKNGVTYYIGMYKGTKQNGIAVIGVSTSNVVTAEKTLSVTVNRSARLTDMKTAKQALAAALM